MRRIIILAAGLLVAMACSQMEQEALEQSSGSLQLTFKASTAPDTKAALGDENTIIWSAGDKIAVLNIDDGGDEHCMPFTLVGEGGSTEGEFTGTVTEVTPEYWAFYPYDENLEHEYFAVTYEWCGYNQQATEGGFDPAVAPMLGYTTYEDNKFGFMNVMSFIKVTTLFPCDQIVISGNDGETLGCQTITVESVAGEPMVTDLTHPKSGVTNVTLRSSTALEGGNIVPGTYLIAVLPQTLSKGFTLEFKGVYGISGKDYEKTTDKSVTLARSHALNVGEFSLESFVAEGEWLGAGTAEDPYIISSPEQLCLLGERLMHGSDSEIEKYATSYYKQSVDIDFEGSVAPSIGMWNYFKGTYDGQNHKISNYKHTWGRSTMSLFSGIEGATLKNIISEPLYFRPMDVERKYPTIRYSGLVGWAYGSGERGEHFNEIINCTANSYDGKVMDIQGSAQTITFAGICAETEGDVKIIGCTNNISVNVHTYLYEFDMYDKVNKCYVAGIVGKSRNDLKDRVIYIDKCVNNGDMTVHVNSTVYCGGIVGFDEDWSNDLALRITNCTNNGDIKHNEGTKGVAESSCVGGIIGMHDSDGDLHVDPWICNCLNNGDLHSNGVDYSRTGGLMGYCYSSLSGEYTHVYACVNTGTLTAGNKPHVGALAGYDGGDYHYCYWTNEGLNAVADDDDYSYALGCKYKSVITAFDMSQALSYIPTYVFAPDVTAYSYPAAIQLWSGSTEDTSGLRIAF